MEYILTICERYISAGYKVKTVLKYAGVASSTWYYHINKYTEDQRKNNPGRAAHGYSINPDGTVILDTAIVKAIKKYRLDPHYHNAGGYHKLKHYLRRDYNYFVNHKKLYRLCKEHNLLLPIRRKKLGRAKK